VREFLSQNAVEFEDRNIAFEPRWRKELLDRTGEIVVPVLFVGGDRVVGLDESGLAKALGLIDAHFDANRDGLLAPPELSAVDADIASEEVSGNLAHLARRLQREMEFNASKDASPYRDGVHDGLRFARDAALRILTRKYEPEKIAAERNSESG
jgi:glutaredoxin